MQTGCYRASEEVVHPQIYFLATRQIANFSRIHKVPSFKIFLGELICLKNKTTKIQRKPWQILIYWLLTHPSSLDLCVFFFLCNYRVSKTGRVMYKRRLLICLFIFYEPEYFAHLLVCVPYAYEGQKRASDSLETGITNGCEPPCRCWKLNLHALEKQSVLSGHWAVSHSPRVIIWFMVLEVKSETDKIIPLQRQRTSRAEFASGPAFERMASVYLQNKTLMMSSPFKSF